MQNLLRFLKSRYFLTTLVMLVVVALVLLVGSVLELSAVYQLLAVIVVLVVFIVVLAVGFIRANQSAAKIEQSIKAQAQQQLMSARPDRRAEIEALQERLERAIEQLKQSKLGRGKRGKAALYALPWYLFIGPPAAGKTTTIVNSGLNFPIGTDRIQGVGGTRNCDWFFSDTAILLDTAGRYTTEYEDNEEWIAFLETLARHRPEQPINGVLVGISIADLIAADPHEIDAHAETIRRRIDELVKHLGVRFPVYLVFTKCDLLQGFVEFFGDLTRQERDEVWGVTLGPVQWEAPEVRALFEEEFDRLCEALSIHRIERLGRSLKREERNRVYTFPLQFAAAREPLGRFVQQVFLPNPYQESPLFRGFYFTSGTQEGVPLDRVIQALAKQFGFAPAVQDTAAEATETKSYFIRNLFTEVVIPDQFLVERTTKATRRGHLVRAGIGVAAAVGLGLFVLWAVLALRSGLRELEAVEQAVTPFQTIRWERPQALEAELQALDSLRMRLDALEDPSWLRLGLRPRQPVVEAARSLYQTNLRAFVAAYPLQELERHLAQARSGMERAEKDTLFKDLKAYLLLTDADQELAPRRDSLIRVNTYDLVRRLSHRAATAAPGHGPARVHLQAFVDALARGEQEPFPGQSSRADRARAAIGDIDEGVYYLQVLDNVQSRLQGEAARLELRDIVRAGSGFFTNDSLGVDGVFTRGAHELVMDEIRLKSENPYSDAWVLGQRQQQSSSEQLEDLEKKLKARYYEAYATAWSAFLRSVTLRRLTTIPEARDAIETLSSAQRSPVVRLLGVATVETDVCNRVSGLLADAGSAQVGEVMTCDGQIVNDRFQWLHAFGFNRAESGSGSPDVDLLLRSFEDIAADLDEVSGSGEDAVLYAEQLVQDEQFGIGGKLRELQRALGASFDRRVRDNLFEAPVLQAGGAVIAAARRSFAERWRREVYDPFQRMAEQYPFTPDASAPDADYGAVRDYFDPDPGIGRVAAFRRDLEPFLERGDLRRPRRWQGYGLELDAIRPALEQAETIGQALARGNLTFRIRPDRTVRGEGAPPAGPLILTLHGQRRQYDQGRFREWWAFQWPGTERGLELQVAGPTGPLARLQTDGIWALFRFMQQAQGEGETSPGIFERVWILPGAGGSFTYRQPLEIEVDRAGEAMLLTPGRFFSFRPPAAP